ncbi:MAG TPA: hypothetical protein VHL58_14055 [Thermoanaerobaculia bacterium]|nr:hypothetical protein [Thermoanaerobaculia bacterium]
MATLMLILFGASAASASIIGRITFQPKRGQAPIPAETLIWLQPIKVENLPKLTPMTLQVAARSKTLVPHVLLVPVGSTVKFPNSDYVTHNIFSVSPNNKFDLGLFRPGMGKSNKFTSAGVVNVYCNIHPQMSAVLQVVDSPYYTQADGSGQFSLDHVVPGKYRLVAWNELGGSARSEIEVDSSGKATGTTTLLLDSKSERVSRHLNKYNQPYTTGPSKDY